MAYRTILLTTDFSDTSKLACPHALELARTFGARLLVTCVEEDRLPPLVIEYTAVAIDDVLRQQRETAERSLAAFVARELPGADVEPIVRVGSPHMEIVRLAEERDVDLIVMATHGRGFITHAILGSTTERVVRNAPCPVFVVRERKQRLGA
jgi:nucleotide-binding universal stress UspA family protein